MARIAQTVPEVIDPVMGSFQRGCSKRQIRTIEAANIRMMNLLNKKDSRRRYGEPVWVAPDPRPTHGATTLVHQFYVPKNSTGVRAKVRFSVSAPHGTIRNRNVIPEFIILPLVARQKVAGRPRRAVIFAVSTDGCSPCSLRWLL